MKGFLLALVSLCMTCTLFAQDTIYIDKQSWTDKKNATEFAIPTKLDKKRTKVEFYTLDGTLKRVEHYSVFNKKQQIRNGKLTQFYPDGKVRREEVYEYDVCLEGKLWAENGSELPFKPYFVSPEYPGGKMAFARKLASTLKYPAKAMHEKIQGMVILQFIIDKEGHIIQPEVAVSVHPLLDEAALNAIKQMSKKCVWSPAKLEGENVQVRFTLPANFRLP